MLKLINNCKVLAENNIYILSLISKKRWIKQ